MTAREFLDEQGRLANATAEKSPVPDRNGHSWMSWAESGKNGTYCRNCGGWAGKIGNSQCRGLRVAMMGAEGS